MNIGFYSCILPNWCYQKGTNEQYTGCQSTSADGRTCYYPQIRYGMKYGGYPSSHEYNDILGWCQQLFPTSYTGSTATYFNNGRMKTASLFWCSEYDEKTPHWCDTIDGYWKDSTLNIDEVFPALLMRTVTCNIQYSYDHTERLPEVHPGNHTKRLPDVYPGEHPGDYMKRLPEAHPGGHPGDHTQWLPDVYPGGHPGDHAERLPDVHPEGLPGDHTECFPELASSRHSFV